eukprot:367207_1
MERAVTELTLLRQKNKILYESLKDNTRKYRNLKAKISVIESENIALKQRSEKYDALIEEHQQLSSDFELLQHSMDGLQTNYNRLMISNHTLVHLRKTTQNQLEMYKKQIEQLTIEKNHAETNWENTDIQLSEHKDIVNKQNLFIRDLCNQLNIVSNRNNINIAMNRMEMDFTQSLTQPQTLKLEISDGDPLGIGPSTWSTQDYESTTMASLQFYNQSHMNSKHELPDIDVMPTLQEHEENSATISSFRQRGRGITAESVVDGKGTHSPFNNHVSLPDFQKKLSPLLPQSTTLTTQDSVHYDV